MLPVAVWKGEGCRGGGPGPPFIGWRVEEAMGAGNGGGRGGSAPGAFVDAREQRLEDDPAWEEARSVVGVDQEPRGGGGAVLGRQEDAHGEAARAAAVRLRWQGRQRVALKWRVEYSATRGVTGVPQAQRGLVVNAAGACAVVGVAAGGAAAAGGDAAGGRAESAGALGGWTVGRAGDGVAGAGGASVACVVLVVLGGRESGAGAGAGEGAPLVGAVWKVAACGRGTVGGVVWSGWGALVPCSGWSAGWAMLRRESGRGSSPQEARIFWMEVRSPS
jgi:hypothetical protein